MTTEEKINLEQQLLNKINAFYYYKERGMEYVQNNFPDNIDFVNINKGKTYEEVKKELLQKMPKD